MKLLYDEKEKIFYCESRYEEKDIPKSAKFRWNPELKYWWTDSVEKAAELAKYADDDLKKRFEPFLNRRNESLEQSRATDADISVPAPQNLEYLPFQRAGIAYASNRDSVLIGDEMGLGKTIQAIGILNLIRTLRKVLVVCPASLKLNWAKEIEKWTTHDLSIGVASSKEAFPETTVVIINYDILKKFQAEIKAHAWDVLIADECHYIKNDKAQRTKQVKAINAHKKVFLTGTPIVNRPIELWSIASFLAPNVFNHFWTYAKRYCDAQHNGYGWDFKGASNLDELQRKLRESIMVRRLKDEVLTDLPPKFRQVIEIPANGLSSFVQAEQDAMAEREETLRTLKAKVQLAKVSDDPDEYKQAVENLRDGVRAAFQNIARIRKETAVAKIPVVIEHLREAIDSSGKVVVFAHHHEVVDSLKDEFGDEAVLIDGRVPNEKRQERVDAFQTDPNVKLFIGSIQASGVGFTLTAASHVVFAELDWVPGNVSQAEDRCHRIGQCNNVLVQHIVLEGSLDATLAKTIVRKQKVIDKALDDKAATEVLAEPVLPFVEVEDEPEPKSKTKKQIEEIAQTLTADQITYIHDSLQLLAARCDGAMELDGMGFNKFDTRLGHELAGQASLSPKQAALGRKIVLKYKRQIPEAIYEAVKGG